MGTIQCGIFALFAILFVFSTMSAQTQVEDIINLQKVGLSSEVIKAVIEADLSQKDIDEVIKLKKANLGDELIIEFIKNIKNRKLKGELQETSKTDAISPLKIIKTYTAKKTKKGLSVSYKTDITDPTFQDIVKKFEDLILEFEMSPEFRRNYYENFIVVNYQGRNLFMADTLVVNVTQLKKIESMITTITGPWKNKIQWKNSLTGKFCYLEIKGNEIFFSTEPTILPSIEESSQKSDLEVGGRESFRSKVLRKMEEGKLALSRGVYDEAITAFESVVKLDSSHMEAIQLLQKAKEKERLRQEEKQEAEKNVPEGMVYIPSTEFHSDKGDPVYVKGLYMDKYEVTNAQFDKFVSATGFQTEVEKTGFGLVYAKDFWKGRNWDKVKGANWRHPEGPKSDISDRMEHPVVHISKQDATEYCKWMNKRLPTEHEWTIACQGPEGFQFSWGGQLPSGKKGGNVRDETAKRTIKWFVAFDYDDGYVFSAPVGSFDPNGFGLYDMSGNVWEWTADSILKGGAWDSLADEVRCEFRAYDYSKHLLQIGFRCVKDFK